MKNHAGLETCAAGTAESGARGMHIKNGCNALTEVHHTKPLEVPVGFAQSRAVEPSAQRCGGKWQRDVNRSARLAWCIGGDERQQGSLAHI